MFSESHLQEESGFIAHSGSSYLAMQRRAASTELLHLEDIESDMDASHTDQGWQVLNISL